jgi:hypothetical protein
MSTNQLMDTRHNIRGGLVDLSSPAAVLTAGGNFILYRSRENIRGNLSSIAMAPPIHCWLAAKPHAPEIFQYTVKEQMGNGYPKKVRITET